MAAAMIDIPHLSRYYSLPEPTLETILHAPTVELVRTLLERISTRARQHEELESEKLKLDVELENAVRTADSKHRVLKGSVEKGLKEIADLRQKIQTEEETKSALKSELESVKSTTTSSNSEVSALKSRITSLETSNRDTLSLLESKNTAYDNLAIELRTQHHKTVELRREVSTLEQTIQSANAASSTTKFREQGLQQEVDSLKRSNEWLDKELKAKSAEYSKYRREKSARVAELQRENEEATSTIEALRRTESTLRNRLEEVGQKADGFLSQIQRMQEEATRQEENFRVELDAASRLAELRKKSVETEKNRQQELHNELELVKEKALTEIGRITAEVQTEHQDKETAEHRVAELEAELERLTSDLAAVSRPGFAPATPRPTVNGYLGGSPAPDRSPSGVFSPSRSRIKGGLSLTQMYTEYSHAKSEVEAEKRRNEKLSATIDEMIQDMESRQPEIEELRADHDRLESDIVEMSSLVDNVGMERDQARKEARRWESQVAGMVREGELLRQQLRDLSSQVKVLLMEVNAQNHGLDNFTTEERNRLERLARGEEDDTSQNTTDTDRFISQNLTTFKNVSELQEQNARLLRLTRELGDQMEGEEAQRQKSQAAHDQEELEALRDKYELCRDEIKSLLTQSQSYIRERDMFRRMLSHRGQLPPGSDLASLFGESTDGAGPPATPPQGSLNVNAQSPLARELADYAKVLKEMQSHFDAYRQETTTDRKTLKEQVDSLSKKNGELRSEVSRRNNEVTLAHERYEMLQANYSMLKSENSELQKRSQSLSESAARQDLRTQQVAEDLVEAKGLLDSMRSENANLKAEKEFWKTVEKRLTEDNESLTTERSKLNTLNANLQNLLNEREHSEGETRRRLQLQVETLDSELRDTKRKLGDELDEGKRAALRREFDHQQSQTRIDDLVASLGSVREEMVAAKTARDHLQLRADELTIELRSAEERLQVLRPQQTAQPSTERTANTPEYAGIERGQDVSREQELALEISELKRDLELAQGELENAKGQVEQYKVISQSSEEELQSLNETQDQYRQEMDKIIGEKDTRIRELEHKIEGITSEISATNSELSTLQAEKAESSRRLEEQKALFDAEIARMKDLSDRNASAAHYYQEDLKAQAEIAQQAQQNYENELVKHAEAAKNVQKVRADYNQLKLEVVELKTEAESARVTLSQSEESWSEARDRFERELSDLKTRRDDVSAQNKLLHQQLDSVSSQITALQQKHTSAIDEASDAINTPSSGLDNLQEVIKYLRREKEIVDVQLELSVQEAKRLRQQLEYTQSQLDDTRLKLNQQRRAEEDNERNAMNYNKLMETINELNLNRESNVTLRLEKSQAQTSLAEKTKLVDELMGQIQPLQARIRELEDEKEVLRQDLRMTQEARERFEQRYQDILHKSDSVDPAELEALKERITALETERDELVSLRQTLQEQVDSIPDQIQQMQDQAAERYEQKRQSMVEQFKARSRELSGKAREKDAALQAAATEKAELEGQLTSLQQELEAAKSERDEALSNRRKAQSPTEGDNIQNGSEDGQVNEGGSTRPTEAEMQALQGKVEAATKKADEEVARSTQLQGEIDVAHSRVLELEGHVAEIQHHLDEDSAQAAEVRPQQQQSQQPDINANGDTDEQLAKLRQDLAQAQQEMEKLRAAVVVNESTPNAETEEDPKSVAEQISDQVEAIRAELDARHSERVHQAEETYKKRADTMKTQLSKKLTEGKESLRQSLSAEHVQALESLKSRYEEELTALRNRHQEELDELRRNENTRFEQFKQTWLAENSAPIRNNDDVVKAEPQGPAAQAPPGTWQPSEAEIKSLLANNPHIKEIVARNVGTKLSKEREIIIARVKDEQQKVLAERLAEAESKATTTREQAVVMEGKRYGVKLNMTENRAKLAQVKIDIVQKAALETPQKPVSEVWAIAKDAKPAPASNQQSQQGTVPSTFGKPTPAAQGTFGQPTPAQGQMRPPSAPGLAQQKPSQVAAVLPNQAQAPQQTPPPVTSTTLIPQQPQPTPKGDQQPSLQGQQGTIPVQQGSNLPIKPQPSQINQRVNAGTGPAALKSLQSSIYSGIPTSTSGRGGLGQANHFPQPPIPTGPQTQQPARGGLGGSMYASRGRGSGIGRGGVPHVQTIQSQASPPSQASPNSATALSMNPGAKQFVPQNNKRPREEGQENAGHDGNGGKRARGGGGGGVGAGQGQGL